MSRSGRLAQCHAALAALLTTVAAWALPVASQSVLAQEPPRVDPGSPPATASSVALTLERAVGLALATAPALAAARAQETAARAAVREAEAARRPTAQVGATTTQYEERSLVAPIHGFTPDDFPAFDQTLVQGELRVSYEIYGGGARAARIDQSEAQAGAAAAVVGTARERTIAETVLSYLEALTRREALDAHLERLEAFAAEQRRVETLLEAGRAAVVDLRRIEASVAGAEAERVRLDALLDTAERELARLTGLAPADTRAAALRDPVLIDELTSETRAIDDAVRAALAARAVAAQPAVAQAEEELRAAEAAVDLAESAYRPRATANGALVEYGSAEGEFTGEWFAGVRLAFSLYEGGSRVERLAAARASRDASAERVRAARDQAEREIDRALAALEQSLASTRSLRRAVESFAEVARIEQLRLEAGTGTQTDFLDAQADLLTARADLARARNGSIAARIELARAAGELSTEWLERNLETVP